MSGVLSVTAVEYSFPEAVCGSSRIMLHANAIVLYFLVFLSANDGHPYAKYNFISLFVVAFLLYICFIYVKWPPVKVLMDHFYTLLTVLSFGFGLTPIVRFVFPLYSTITAVVVISELTYFVRPLLY